jgi:hypothetical protein
MEKDLGVNMKTDVTVCEVPLGSVLLLNNLIPHRSLENYSDKIRWSLDLRWQHPAHHNGFAEIKPCIEMARESDPTFVPDWEAWARQSRHEQATNWHANGEGEAAFDTTISGPWMKRWPITHHNKHTRSMKA